MARLPFPIKRLVLLARGQRVDRNNPDFTHLEAIEDPEEFVWAILPHAARSFAPSILLLPREAALAAAVGYLYARMLDTYEDLSTSRPAARTALAGFADRFESHPPTPAPPAPKPNQPDARDRTHLLLISRHGLVDSVFNGLDQPSQDRIVRLVRDMSSGMQQYSSVFEAQNGVLQTEAQVIDYCHHVIGLPALFVLELLVGDVTAEQMQDALEVSELIQLANITRDIEKDLGHGVAYHPRLAPHLRSDVREAADDIEIARAELMAMASRRAPSFRRLLHAVNLPRFSPARSAAVLMILYTHRHYVDYSGRNVEASWLAPRRLVTMILAALPATFSPVWAEAVLVRVERDLTLSG